MVLRLLASALALILTFGSTGVYAATTTGYKNDDVKLTATRDEESNKIAVTLYADREMYEPFFSFIYSAAAETNNATFDSYTANMNIFNSNNSNPQRMVHLMNGGHSPQKDDELFSIIYKIDGDFEADKDYTFLVQFDEAFDGNFEYYKWSADAMEVTYRENTVSFDLNDGEAGSNDYSDQLVVTGEKASDPGDPTREGYVFKGWKAAESDTDYFKFDTPITQKTKLTADWAKEFEVSYKATGDIPDDYTAPKTVKKLKGDEVTVEAAPESPVTGTKDGISGTYTFTGWTAPEGVTVEDGKFTMPEKNVEFTGEWKFTPSTHSVSYSVTGDIPEGYTAPGKKIVNEGASVEVEAKANTDKTANAEGVPGTYTFEGWTAPEGVTVEDGKFTMPGKDVEFTGTWTFKEAAKHTVKYEVNEEGGKPDNITGDVPADATYYEGDNVTVAPGLTTTSTTNGDKKGTWSFAWNKTGDFTMGDKDVTITGTWTFKEADKHKVKYVVNEEGDKPAEDSITGTVPADADYYEGDNVTVAPALSTEDKTNGNKQGTWSFAWDKTGDFEMGKEDVTITGTWTFKEADKHTVTYEISNGDAPSQVSGTTPDAKEYYAGQTVNIAAPLTTTETTKDGKPGTWTFAWNPAEDFTMGSEDVTITGTWTFTEAAKHTVRYEISDGDKPDNATITGTVPENADYYAGETVAVAPALTTTSTKNGDKEGTWKFTWSRTGSFQMGSDDVTITGTWTFTETDKYTVDTDTANHTYQIFQIFTGDLSSKTVEEGGQEVTKDILSNLVWGENGTGSKGEEVPEEAINALNAVVGEELDKDKLAVIENYVDTTGTPVKEITASGTASVDLPAGYYLIRDLPDSQDGEDDAYTTYITVVVKDYTVKPKSAKPTVDKKVAGGETADYAINQTFQFTLTASLPADTDFAAYEKYKLTFNDTMSSGITFEKIDSVTVDGITIDSSKYTPTAKEGQKGGDWTLTIEDIKTAASGVDITDGCDVVVTYSAHLNEAAIAHSTGGEIAAENANTNSVKLTYSNNPNTGGDGDTGETTTDDKVWVFTYEVDNTKMGETDGKQSPLKDAGFKLYSEDGNTEIPLAYDAADNVYYPAAAGTVGVEMKSAADGTFNIKGLDAGTYTLKETTTPAGYNTCDDTKVKISATHGEDPAGTKAKLTFSNDSTVKNKIINKSGNELPTTGGIGTTIFYVVGGILVIGAGVILITRKRMAD